MAVPRPGRLWVATLLDIFYGFLVVGFLLFLFTSERIPNGVQPGVFGATFAGILGCTLISFSVLALAGRYWARRALLVVATIHFGSVIIQNLLPLLGLGDSIVPTGSW